MCMTRDVWGWLKIAPSRVITLALFGRFVLYDAELVALRIFEDNDSAFPVLVALSGLTAAEMQYTLNRTIHIIDRHIQMDADLPTLGLRNRLEVDPWLVVVPRRQLDPARQARLGIAVEQCTPERGEPHRIDAIDC